MKLSQLFLLELEVKVYESSTGETLSANFLKTAEWMGITFHPAAFNVASYFHSQNRNNFVLFLTFNRPNDQEEDSVCVNAESQFWFSAFFSSKRTYLVI